MQAVLKRFLRFEGVPPQVIIVTALVSYVLQINSIVTGDPLYMIALVTLLPWVPLFLFEGIWKVKNYSLVAVLALFTLLQLGHFAEHLIQVLQLQVFNGTVACPPPIDNLGNFGRAVELGLRDAAGQPSYFSVESIAKATPEGLPLLDDQGNYVTGPAACAIFGQLDLEIVHLVWELIGYFGTAFVLFHFIKNRWLFIALLCLTWHGVEHLTITYFYYFDQEPMWPGFTQLWATVQIEGNKYLAVPAGLQETMLNFYQAGGKFGIMAKHGFFQQVTGFEGMPNRAVLHMCYNMAITIPTVIGCLVEMRKIKNAYLAQSFANLSEDELVKLTNETTTRKFAKDEVIFNQGDASTDAFVIKTGKVGIYLNYGETDEIMVATLHSSDLLGEMGIVEGKDRSATAVALSRVEMIEINAQTFRDLMTPVGGNYQSGETAFEIERLVQIRKAATAVIADA